jgi:hypothetical protein
MTLKIGYKKQKINIKNIDAFKSSLAPVLHCPGIDEVGSGCIEFCCIAMQRHSELSYGAKELANL